MRHLAIRCIDWVEDANVIHREDVREAVESEVQSISRIAHLLYRMVFNNVTPPPMDELDYELDTSDKVTQFERDASETISEALSD